MNRPSQRTTQTNHAFSLSAMTGAFAAQTALINKLPRRLMGTTVPLGKY
jgi:hypothetical protein